MLELSSSSPTWNSQSILYKEGAASILLLKQEVQDLQRAKGSEWDTKHRKCEQLFWTASEKLEKLSKTYQDPITAQKVLSLEGEFLSVKSKLKRMERPSNHPQSSGQAEIEPDQKNIRMQVLNGESEQMIDPFQLKLEHQKQKELITAQKSMVNIHKITREISQLTQKQGEKLELVDGNVNKTWENTKFANSQLDAAARYQQKSRCKYCWIALGIIGALILLAALLLIL